MNLLADESVEGHVVERLRHDGHDVVYVAELAPSIVDEEVLHQAPGSSSGDVADDAGKAPAAA